MKTRQNLFICPGCGYNDKEFHYVCPGCGRPFVRDFIDTRSTHGTQILPEFIREYSGHGFFRNAYCRDVPSACSPHLAVSQNFCNIVADTPAI